MLIREAKEASFIIIFVINKLLKREVIIIKKYEIGMYGGKFMPFHKGHYYCLETAASECEKVYLILFYGGLQEKKVKQHDNYLNVSERIKYLQNIIKKFNNVELTLIDVSNLIKEDGTEDWDAETPLVRKVVGNKLDAVYSSEISYDPYFKRAYPEAVHRIIDPDRKKFPISGTKIRNMKNKEEREKWII